MVALERIKVFSEKGFKINCFLKFNSNLSTKNYILIELFLYFIYIRRCNIHTPPHSSSHKNVYREFFITIHILILWGVLDESPNNFDFSYEFHIYEIKPMIILCSYYYIICVMAL